MEVSLNTLLRAPLKNAKTDIIRDYPGRFYLDEKELRRLIAELEIVMLQGLPRSDLSVKYCVGLENGIIYENDNIDVLLSEENARKLTIRLIIIFAELVNQAKEPVRKVIIHFSRAKRTRKDDMLIVFDETFNINFRGLSYRITDKDRDAALRLINSLEERLGKFRRWHNSIPEFPLSLQFVFAQLLFICLVGAILVLLPNIWPQQDVVVFSRSSYALINSFGSLILVVGVAVALILVLLLVFNWLLSSSVIAIGDEIQINKRGQKLREYVLWSVVVAAIVGVLVNILTSQL